MPILPEIAKEITLPRLVPVKQVFPDEHIHDVPATVAAEFQREEIIKAVEAGKTAALLVGSRGISNLDVVVKSTVDALLAMGLKPFIVPAMGSHGGGIAEEQKKILEGYGITEEAMGIPIQASMETIVIGTTEGGCPVHVDKLASQADYIVPIARVKVHTDFDGEIESGLCKMLSIGLGKHNGCSRIHQEGFPNFPTVLPQVASKVMETFCVPFGVALIENAHENLHTIRVVAGKRMIEEEKELLKLSKSLMPRLCFDHIDVLIVDKIGKDITGAGMDPNITGRIAGMPPSPYFTGPTITRIVVNQISEASHGNAVGMGCADFITKKLYDSIDLTPTYTNMMASCVPENAKIPMIFSDEEEALLAAIVSCPKIDKNNAKVVRIKDTLHLIDIEVSENLLDYCKRSSAFII
ncbi:MAG: hypothetical protein HFE73_03875 [Firmicutes bacterium]|jgi:hypothetical protein|nr:hypothetical protein [Bacillota bacterium]